MSDNKKQRLIDRAFVVSMWLKGIDGVLELLGSVLLLITSPVLIQRLALLLVQDELGEDPHDILANVIIRFGHQLGSARLFTAVYLLSHGAVKVLLVTYLLQRKVKMYPVALAFLSVFAVYQAYLTWQSFSAFFLLLTLFDFLIVFLVWQEYKHLLQDGQKG